MKRRDFLSAASTSAIAVVGCDEVESSTHKPSPTLPPAPSRTTAAPTPESAPLPPAASNWEELAKILEGRIVTKESSDYRAAHLLHNSAYDAVTPQAVVRVTNAADVAHCVRFAQSMKLPLSVRSGGHSYLGASVGEGLVIHLGELSGVSHAADSSHVRVGPGIQLIDFYTELAKLGRTVPGGSCPTAGLGGLALGGGHGLTSRAHGLTCDRVSSLDVVTARGEVLEVSAKSHPDLFWALRGGGGSFGVVTGLTLSTEPQPPRVTTIMLLYKWEQAGDALTRWMKWIVVLPRELSVVARLSTTGSLVIAGVNLGSLDETQDRIRPLLSGVSKRSIQPHSFLDAMMLEAGCSQRSLQECHLKATSSKGQLKRALPFAASSLYFEKSLSGRVIELAISQIDEYRARIQSGAASIQFDAYGGAINDVPAGATAFCHRKALCCAQISSTFTKGKEGPHRAWVSNTRKTLTPFSNGESYQNYNDASLTDFGKAYYGKNYTRLLEIKRSYDPENVFRFAQSLG